MRIGKAALDRFPPVAGNQSKLRKKMESFLLQKITARKIKDFLNNILFFFVILSVVFYPLVFSVSYSIAAEEESSIETSDSSDSEEAEEEKEDSSEEEEEADDEEESIDNEEEGADESSDKETIEESPIEEQESEDAGSELNISPGSTQIDEASATGSMETSEDNDSDEDDFWKTCDLSDEKEEWIESEECEECREKTDCEEIEICIVEKIENVNDTEVANDVSSEADTGNNVASENSDSSVSPDGTECKVLADCPEEITEDNPIEAETGESGIEESEETIQEQAVESEAVIDTGEAVATANVYNEANINIVSENYASEILNISGEYVGDIDLLEKFQELLEKALVNEETVLIEVSNTNEADVENIVNTEANTGNNSIKGTDGNITTGDASAASNLVNYVNLNITGNNWLFYAINVFGEWAGNLIVPGEGLLEVPETSDSALSQVINENSADVENNIETNSNTGGNEITGEGSVSTGEAVTVTNVKNIVNTNIVRNNWFFLMVNNMGSWKGKVLGWDGGNSINNIFSYDFDIFDGGDSFLGSIFSVYNKNTASVSNSVSASASTGNNSIEGADGDISTGNAFAWSNIFNLINTNITGNNWMFSIVNVMGEWKGDAVFAYPDLKISINDGKDDADPGEELSYSVEYENVGQAACEDAKVYVGLPKYFSYKSDSAGADYSYESGTMAWDLGALEPGEKKSFTVKGKISEEFPEGETTLMAGAGITTSTKEIESGNNSATDETKVSIYSALNHVEYPEIDPEIKITREVAPGSFVRQGNIVLYSIILENEGDTPIYDLVVKDMIKNEIGELGGYEWSVGDIGEGEKILIQYQVIISGNAPLGLYTNRAVAYGEDAYGEDYESGKAISQVRVLGGMAYGNYTGNQDSGSSILAAQAAETPVVLGEASGCSEWPFWVWMLILMGYTGGVSMIIIRDFKSSMSKGGSLVVSAGGIFALWYFFERCRLYPAYPYFIVGIPILLYLIYLSWRKKMTRRSSI